MLNKEMLILQSNVLPSEAILTIVPTIMPPLSATHLHILYTDTANVIENGPLYKDSPVEYSIETNRVIAINVWDTRIQYKITPLNNIENFRETTAELYFSLKGNVTLEITVHE